MMKQKRQTGQLSVVEGGRELNRVLITGGAGFIGSHLARRLLGLGYQVRVLDNLEPQVHGPAARRPSYLEDDVELIVGDIRDHDAVAGALEGCDAVVHLAACVGVGQSMYEIVKYASVNTEGTAVLLQTLIDRPIRKLVVASSMSIYGEGLYRTRGGALRETVQRPRDQLEQGRWEAVDEDGGQLEPLPTPEWKRPALSSIYALGKYDQERMCLMFGETYRIPTVAARFFNVYGPDQALSNPYTGVLAIFAGRLLNEKAPLIYEDGRQRRDFVSVHDVVQGLVLALERPGADGQAVNLGSGHHLSILDVARKLGDVLGRPGVMPALTGKYRVGDIRHCFADVTTARETLGYEPQIRLEEGMQELAEWLEGQVADDHVESAAAELQARGLTL